MRIVAYGAAFGTRRPWSGAAAICSILCLPFLLAGCGSSRREPTVEKFVETREVRGAWVTVTLITGNGKRAVAASDAAFACLDSVTASTGAAADGPVEAAADKVTVLAPGARADRGDLAQGHAIDRAIAALRREGVADGIVQIGEMLRCFGAIPAALVDQEAVLPVRTLRSRSVKHRDGGGAADGRETVFEGLRRSEGASPADPRAWRFDLPDPFAERPLGRIQVGDQAVATRAVAGEPAAVTVIAGTALEAGTLAQVVAALGAQRGVALAESLPDAEALIATGGTRASDLLRTSGFPVLEPVP